VRNLASIFDTGRLWRGTTTSKSTAVIKFSWRFYHFSVKIWANLSKKTSHVALLKRILQEIPRTGSTCVIADGFQNVDSFW